MDRASLIAGLERIKPHEWPLFLEPVRDRDHGWKRARWWTGELQRQGLACLLLVGVDKAPPDGNPGWSHRVTLWPRT